MRVIIVYYDGVEMPSINLVNPDFALIVYTQHIVVRDAEYIGSEKDGTSDPDCWGPFLVDDKRSRLTTLYPLKDTRQQHNYFSDFLSMHPTDSEIIQYANRYGCLIKGLCLDSSVYHHSSSLHFWKRMHWFVSNMFELLQLIQAKDTTQLAKRIKWNEERITFTLGSTNDIQPPYWTDGHSHMIRFFDFFAKLEGVWKDPPIQDEQYRTISPYNAFKLTGEYDMNYHLFHKQVKPGDVIFPAAYLFCGLLEEQMKEYPVRITPRIDSFKIVDSFFPTSLLALLWYTIYQIAIGERRYARCSVCNQWQDVTDYTTAWRRHDACARKEQDKRTALRDKIKFLRAKGTSDVDIIAKLKISMDDLNDALIQRKKGRKKQQ